MRKLKHNQSGFGVVGVILIVVVVGLLGLVGWTYFKNQKKVTPSSTTTAVAKTATTTTDPTVGWTPYVSTTGKFSIKYPKAWVTATNPDSCSNTAESGVFLLGANSSSVGKCASEDFGQITVTWRTDRQLCGDLNSDAWTQESKTTVTVGGVSATKIEATAKAPGAGNGTVPEGTKTVQYCAIANNATYIADYTQQAHYPDVLSDFNTMITKTLKF